MNNIFVSPAMGIASKTWTTGLGSYTQANCQVTFTDRGYRIYRPPNKTPSADGSTMWGGMRLINSTTASLSHTYDPAIDNFFGLIQGHSYIIRFHVSGKSSNPFSTFAWTNQMGWGGGGLTPNPSNIEAHGIPTNFNGEEECFYKFTINDTIAKTCTTTYSYAVQGNTYLSYTHFGVGFSYTDTGALGTDIYITNLRMYDITNGASYSINKQGQLIQNEIIECGDIASIQKGGSILCHNFQEY